MVPPPLQPWAGRVWRNGMIIGDQNEVTIAVLEAMEKTPDPRLRELVTLMIKHLHRFIRETWRGELCHWCALGCAPVFFLWNPWWADLIMVGYGLLANLPCILAQRYNRLRLQRLLSRRS
jgi:hypothetical protein